MLVQFQKEFLDPLFHPRWCAKFAGHQRIREHIPPKNPITYYDKAIVSVDTLKNDRDSGFSSNNANWTSIRNREVPERGGAGPVQDPENQTARPWQSALATRSETFDPALSHIRK